MHLIFSVAIFIVYFPNILFSQYFNGVIKSHTVLFDSERVINSYENVYEIAGWTYEEFKNRYITTYFCEDTLISIKNTGQISENIMVQITNDIYFYRKDNNEFYLSNIDKQSIFSKIIEYKKMDKNENILGFETIKYNSYIESEQTKIDFNIANNLLFPSSIKQKYLFDMYFYNLGMILKTKIEYGNLISENKVISIEQKQLNCKSILIDLGFY